MIHLADNNLFEQFLTKAQRIYPEIPKGLNINHVAMHWSATPYGWAIERAPDFPYNYAADVGKIGDVVFVKGFDLSKNAREIPEDAKPDIDYCAATWHRNSFAAATCAICLGGDDTGPYNFGEWPLTLHLVEGLCALTAAVCAACNLDATNPQVCFTHAEAAIQDGYFWGDPTPDGITRGDLACLAPLDPSITGEALKEVARQTADALRRRVHEYKAALLQDRGALNLR